MESYTVASKALVHVCVPDSDHSCIMDISLDTGFFHCKFRTRAQLHDSVKKAFVYLLLDTSHVRSLETCDDDEAIPHSVINAFTKRAVNASSNDFTVLRFALKSHAPLIVPDLMLHKKSSYDDLKALLSIGQCEAFKVYVLSTALNSDGLLKLCNALDKETLQPAPEGVINSLYVNTSYKRITHVDQLWSSKSIESPPPYDLSTAPGASNDESTNLSEPLPSSSPRWHGKRRSVSPDLLQKPSKRQLLTEKAAAQPWELAIAAQGAQIAALRTELLGLREQVQELQRAPGVDAETQTDPVVEHGSEFFPRADPSDEAHTPASTVEDSIHDQFMMFRETFDEKFEEKFEENFDEIFDKKIEGRLYKLEIDVLNEQALRWKSEGRLGAKLENMRESLERKLEDSNIQVRAH